MMLPLLGGTPAVWNTCMVFFQAILLLGYAYSHATTTLLGPRKQAAAHLLVLALPFAFFLLNGPLAVNANLIAGREGSPITALLLVLSLSVGVPMFVVCTSAPLLQRWFASTDHPAAADPYFLYGASNLGSMLALVGYPALIEPFFTLQGQRFDWAIGYVLLALLTVACGWLMWKSKPAAELVLETGHNPGTGSTSPGLLPAEEALVSSAIKAAEKGVSRERSKAPRKPVQEAAPEPEERMTKPVTWQRRLRWMMLAAVPSSLMLGVTTYMTTDIAAIPLLWIPPLALYLLTFIIVFARISPRGQSIATLVTLDALVLWLIIWIVPKFNLDQSFIWLIRVIGVGLVGFSFQILRLRDPALIHRVMIMVMPLIVLLIVFMMLSEERPGVVANIALHLVALLIVSMVCHGELARDRPAPKYLTEYFLLMSIGGVIGGLFNALFAPVAFNALIEYPLVMMVACLLLPPLGFGKDSVWARRADLALAGVFLLVGALLLLMCYRDDASRPDLSPLKTGPWQWGLAAFALAGLLGAVAARRGWGAPPVEGGGGKPDDHWVDRVLDLVLPLALLVLVLGLYWGLPAKGVAGRLKGFADMVAMELPRFRNILTFGLPAVLCYTFVERSVRFGLGVGAILLAAGFSNIVHDSAMYQQRSFFGVLRVEGNVNYKDGYVYPFHRLVHGTTLHGKQFLEDGLRDTPLTYYHRTGPVGLVFRAYNTDAKRPMAVIGLGTGTMACYALPGQTVDFFDIDPVVVDISYDTDKFFTYVEDAEERGANVSLVLGDARLTFEPKGDKVRLKPLHKREGEKVPARQFGEPLTPDFRYGLIVVDAFSSDAIPIHLITKQALEIYRERLLEDGVLCMHISNRYLDLQPVLANIVEELGMVGYHMSDDDNAAAGKNRSHWVAIARKKEHLAKILQPTRWEQDGEQLSLLGTALWPAQATTGLAACTSLGYAFQRIVDVNAAEKEKKTRTPTFSSEWKPLDTREYVESELAQVEQALAKNKEETARARENGDKKKEEEAEKEWERLEKQKDEVLKKIPYRRKVGIWTDDYSNLLSVFSW
jgi:hypothetical protein